MKTTRLTLLGLAGALLLSTAAQADDTDSTVTSAQLQEQSRLRATEYGRDLATGDAGIQRNRVWSMQGVQDGSYTDAPAQNRQQTRTREQKRLRNREHAGQGSGPGTRYGQGYESRGGGSSRHGTGGAARSGGQGRGSR